MQTRHAIPAGAEQGIHRLAQPRPQPTRTRRSGAASRRRDASRSRAASASRPRPCRRRADPAAVRSRVRLQLRFDLEVVAPLPGRRHRRDASNFEREGVAGQARTTRATRPCASCTSPMSRSSTSTITRKSCSGASVISASPFLTGAPSDCVRSPVITTPSNGATTCVRCSGPGPGRAGRGPPPAWRPGWQPRRGPA